MSGPIFFFSYCREDEDVWLNQFFDDLVKEVRALDKNTGQTIAFRDTRSVELGEDWSQGIATALQHAKVMVCAFSKKYFYREWCGKEWSAFADRMAAHPQQAGDAALIIPVLWMVPDEVPAVARVGQWTNHNFPAAYEEKGLRHVAKLKRDDYLQAVEAIAEAISRGVKRDLPSASSPPDYARARNAFQAPGGAVAGAPQPAAGPKFVEFVVAAGRADEVRPLRGDDASNYGASSLDWVPYAPGSRRRVGPLLQSVASGADFDLDSRTTPLDEQLDQLLVTAEANNSIVILTVDPWSLKLDRYWSALQAYDQRLSLNAAAVLPWNNDDPVTREKADELDRAVRASLAKHSLTNAPTLHTRVASENEFVERVQNAIRRAQGLIVQYREVQSRADRGTTLAKPQISAKREPDTAGAPSTPGT